MVFQMIQVKFASDDTANNIHLLCILYIKSDLYYPWYLGILNFGLKTADNRGVDNRGFNVLHIS